MAFRDFHRWSLLWDSGIPLKGLSSTPLATALLNLAFAVSVQDTESIVFPSGYVQATLFQCI